MTPLRHLGKRTPPHLHAALVAGWSALVFTLANHFEAVIGEAEMVVIASLLIFFGSRFLGWAVNRFGGLESNPIGGAVYIEQLEAALIQSIHEQVDALSIMQSETQILIGKFDRLHSAIDRATRHYEEPTPPTPPVDLLPP